jgi:hypothetical protein
MAMHVDEATETGAVDARGLDLFEDGGRPLEPWPRWALWVCIGYLGLLGWAYVVEPRLLAGVFALAVAGIATGLLRK